MIFTSGLCSLDIGYVVYCGLIPSFDEYPCCLLGITRAIEVVTTTGFLLINQNHEAAYSEKTR
jgi:hypothetical protein